MSINNNSGTLDSLHLSSYQIISSPAGTIDNNGHPLFNNMINIVTLPNARLIGTRNHLVQSVANHQQLIVNLDIVTEYSDTNDARPTINNNIDIGISPYNLENEVPEEFEMYFWEFDQIILNIQIDINNFFSFEGIAKRGKKIKQIIMSTSANTNPGGGHIDNRGRGNRDNKFNNSETPIKPGIVKGKNILNTKDNNTKDKKNK